MDKHTFHLGKAFDAYEYFGAHRVKDGFVFRTYAPGASMVSLIGEFNDWTNQEMERDSSGIWSTQSSSAQPGQMYKYRIRTSEGRVVDHCDPYGFGMELRPNNASFIRDLSEHKFYDRRWMRTRGANHQAPMNIYEVHLGSWRTADDGSWLNYSEIADRLIPYVKEWGYTHIEVMPLSEHPSDESWGYQNTGFYSPTSRYGTAKDLMEFTDKCHQAEIGVIIDFVPVHFAVDDYALNMYDGSALYEYPSSDVTVSEWGSCNFNYSRGEVASFIQSAANYWLTEYHFDGIRMDAVSRAIYWQGDEKRGVNSRAVDFIKIMNQGLKRLHPDVMLFAEDSTSFPQVTAPVQYGGLGFDYKWNMGWMNDTLNFFRTPPEERPVHYHKITFSIQYFYSELFLLPFSHDEVVHGKATIIQKMWGDYQDKFLQMRALYVYMMAHPGKKLNFMGNELAQFREWDEKREQDWDILKFPLHDAFHQFIKELNFIYLNNPALYEHDYDMKKFHWLEANAPEDCVYAFERMAKYEKLIAVFNFSDKDKKNYPLKLSESGSLTRLISSDDEKWGGNSKLDSEPIKSAIKDENHVAYIDLPKFSGQIFIMQT